MGISKMTIQLRRDSTKNWLSANPILRDGEYAYATDTGYVTVGNGISSYLELQNSDMATIRLPKTAIDGLADVNENTIYNLSSDGKTGFALLSADGTETSAEWGVVNTFSADWTADIQQAASDAVVSALSLAKQKIEELSNLLNPKIDSAIEDIKELSSTTEGLTNDVSELSTKVNSLSSAMHFRGVYEELPPADFFEPGDIIIVKGEEGEAEYVLCEYETGKEWAKLGDESMYETKADAEAKLSSAKEYTDSKLSVITIPSEPTTWIGQNNTKTKTYFCVAANGIPVVIRQGDTDNIVNIWYDHDTKKISVNRNNYNGGVQVYGGCYNTDDNPTYIPATSIVMESGIVASIYGGSCNSGNVGVANVTINGGEVTSGVSGGRSDGGLVTPTQKSHNNNIGLLNITVNDGKIYTVYGGGAGYSTQNKSVITVNGGDIDYLTASGSNGTTLNSSVTVNGGIIDTYQSVNNGMICNAELTLNGGVIDKCFAGGEYDFSKSEPSVPGTVLKSVLNLLDGTINRLSFGESGNIYPLAKAKVSGRYVERMITSVNDPENVKECLVLAGSELGLKRLAYKDYVEQEDMEGEFLFDCGNAFVMTK